MPFGGGADENATWVEHNLAGQVLDICYAICQWAVCKPASVCTWQGDCRPWPRHVQRVRDCILSLKYQTITGGRDGGPLSLQRQVATLLALLDVGQARVHRWQGMVANQTKGRSASIEGLRGPEPPPTQSWTLHLKRWQICMAIFQKIFRRISRCSSSCASQTCGRIPNSQMQV